MRLAALTHSAGEIDQAEGLVREALSVRHAVQDSVGIAECRYRLVLSAT